MLRQTKDINPVIQDVPGAVAQTRAAGAAVAGAAGMADGSAAAAEHG